jgi:DNA repair protein RadC
LWTAIKESVTIEESNQREKEAKRMSLQAAARVQIKESVAAKDQAELYELFARPIAWERVECFAIASLNANNKLLGVDVICKNTKMVDLAPPAEILGYATRRRASRVVIAHNHLCGDTEPSADNIALTQQIIDAGKEMGIPVLDHLIVAGNNFKSLRETHSFEWDC